MGNNSSYFKDNSKNPVEQLSWDDAQEFCQKLNEKTGKKYRLPSEAEWDTLVEQALKLVYKNAPTDGTAWNDNHAQTDYRVLRGGSWVNSSTNCRSASPVLYAYRSYEYGFRVVSPQDF